MTEPLAVLTVGACRVLVWRPDFIETHFPDGRRCPALFVEDDQARQHASEWGYGADVARMHLEHELTHTLLARSVGQPYSPVLYHVAGGTHVPVTARAAEEGRVVAVQRISNQLTDLVRQYRVAVQESRRLTPKVFWCADCGGAISGLIGYVRATPCTCEVSEP